MCRSLLVMIDLDKYVGDTKRRLIMTKRGHISINIHDDNDLDLGILIEGVIRDKLNDGTTLYKYTQTVLDLTILTGWK